MHTLATATVVYWLQYSPMVVNMWLSLEQCVITDMID